MEAAGQLGGLAPIHTSLTISSVFSPPTEEVVLRGGGGGGGAPHPLLLLLLPTPTHLHTPPQSAVQEKSCKREKTVEFTSVRFLLSSHLSFPVGVSG